MCGVVASSGEYWYVWHAMPFTKIPVPYIYGKTREISEHGCQNYTLSAHYTTDLIVRKMQGILVTRGTVELFCSKGEADFASGCRGDETG